MTTIRLDDVAILERPDPWPTAPDLPGQPDPNPLPLEVLPTALREHVRSVAHATQTPPDLAALLALASVSAAVGGRVDVVADERRGWTEPPALFICGILPPASRKSPVFSAMTAPLADHERERREAIRPEYERAQNRVAVAAARLDAAKTAAAKGKGSLDDVDRAQDELSAATAGAPVMPRIFLNDSTPEALVRLLAQQDGRMALFSPEGDPFNLVDGRYSDGAIRAAELKQAWSAEPLTVDRVGREAVRIERPSLTVAITMQPGVLESLRNGRAMRGEGLLGRFLWAVPAHGLGGRLTGAQVPALNLHAAGRYASVLRTLLAESYDLAAPVRLTLSAAAQHVLFQLEAEVEHELADGARLAGIRDWAGKMVGQAVRLAALLHLAHRAEEGRPLFAEPVAGWAMEAGASLVRALATHALVVLDGVGTNRSGVLLRYVLRRAKGLPDGSTLRDLWQATRDKSGIDEMADLRTLVEELEERACLRLVDVHREGPGRPPSPLLELHPTLRKSGVPAREAEARPEMDLLPVGVDEPQEYTI